MKYKPGETVVVQTASGLSSFAEIQYYHTVLGLYDVLLLSFNKKGELAYTGESLLCGEEKILHKAACVQ